MSQQIVSAILGFILGIVATVIVERVVRRYLHNDPRRKRKLEQLQIIEKWLDSYRALFDGTYPECPELVLAHKMLSPMYPHYDKAAPLNLYKALKEYRTLQIKHDELTSQAAAALQALSNKNLARLHGLNKNVSSVLQKAGLLKGSLLFPANFTNDMSDHIKIIDGYHEKVFEAFPRRFIQEIEWDKLDSVDPEELTSIIHPRLKYYTGEEATSAHRETESRRFDEMQNLAFYRIAAKKEIDAIIQKIHRQEEKNSVG